MWTRFDKILFAFLLASIAVVLFTPYWYSLMSKISLDLASPYGIPTGYGILANYIILFLIFVIITW